jgi:hypothetical protein
MRSRPRRFGHRGAHGNGRDAASGDRREVEVTLSVHGRRSVNDLAVSLSATRFSSTTSTRSTSRTTRPPIPALSRRGSEDRGVADASRGGEQAPLRGIGD